MIETKISGRKHPVIKHAVSILTSAKQRDEEKLFIAEGARLCADTAKSGTEIKRLFVTEKAVQKYQKYIDLIREKAEEIYIVEDHVASLLSDTKNSQGVFALCSFSEQKASIKGKVLVMENLQDPGNIGTIFRTAEALGIETLVLLGECCDVYSPKVIRSTMGAIFRVNFLKIADFDTVFKLLNEKNYQSFAAVPSDKAEKVNSLVFNEKTAVFIGNEGNGLSEICKEKLQNITIPMNGNAESLNASIAASIIMWEMVRNV